MIYKKIVLILMIIVLFQVNLYAYEKEDRLIGAIMGNIGKFSYGNNTNIDPYTITVLNNQFSNMLDRLYRNAKINNKRVKIKYITKIRDIKPSSILYIFKTSPKELRHIFSYIKNKSILTISKIKGFAQRGGMVQIYKKDGKLKLKINLKAVKKEDIRMKASLLRIAQIVK